MLTKTVTVGPSWGLASLVVPVGQVAGAKAVRTRLASVQDVAPSVMASV